MKTNFILFIIACIICVSCNQSSNQPENSASNETKNVTPKKTHEEIMEDARILEVSKPTEYLSVTYKLDYKVFSGKDVVRGTISSSAASASYKDINLKITFYSKTDTELGSEEYVVYDFVNPGTSIKFEIKLKSPKGTQKIGVQVVGAKDALEN